MSEVPELTYGALQALAAEGGEDAAKKIANAICTSRLDLITSDGRLKDRLSAAIRLLTTRPKVSTFLVSQVGQMFVQYSLATCVVKGRRGVYVFNLENVPGVSREGWADTAAASAVLDGLPPGNSRFRALLGARHVLKAVVDGADPQLLLRLVEERLWRTNR